MELCMYMHIVIYMLVQVPLDARGVGFTGTAFTDDCELPGKGTEKWTQVLWKNSRFLTTETSLWPHYFIAFTCTGLNLSF